MKKEWQMILIDVNYQAVNLNNEQSIASRIWNKIYENRISCLFFSSIFFAADFIGGFIIHDPTWVTPVMLTTGMGGSFISLAMLCREVDLRRRG
jgi:hypothetical protein